VAWAQGRAAKVIEAQEFRVVDVAGRERGSWGTTDDGAVRLSLLDRNGDLRATVAVEEEGPVLLMQGRGQKPGLKLRVDSREGPALLAWDRDGRDLDVTPELEGASNPPSPMQAGKPLRVLAKDDEKHKLLLEDGSWWEINPEYDSALFAYFSAQESVTILKGTDPEWPYQLVEKEGGHIIEARPARN
jgi:hypothetical protein